MQERLGIDCRSNPHNLICKKIPTTSKERSFIKNMSLEESVGLFRTIGEKDYRGKQLYNWLYEKNEDSFYNMTNFSKSLRNYLDERYSISPLILKERFTSKIDGTEKYLFKTYDDHYIESLLIKNEACDDGRLTICISSQIGCAMDCVFCQTAKIGFKRNLEVAEILDQICQIRRISGLKNNNIVFMGMGEPFLNYDNVLKAADIMNYSFGFHISARKITLSTCGIKKGIQRFFDERRSYNLAISLNDTIPKKRRAIMPIEKKYPFLEIAELLNRRLPASRNRLTIEYVMRKDNISTEDARRLGNMFNLGNKFHLNLIPLSSGDHNLRTPSEDEIMAFVKELQMMNIPITIRKSSGEDIDGACGQLRGRYDE